MQSIKLVIQRLDHVSRATNVSFRSRRLGLVSAGEANVSVSGGERLGLDLLRLSCPSLDKTLLEVDSRLQR